MNLYRLIIPRAAEQHGLITPADALAVGGTRTGLVDLERRGIIERLAHAVYRIPELAGPTTRQPRSSIPGANVFVASRLGCPCRPRDTRLVVIGSQTDLLWCHWPEGERLAVGLGGRL